MNVLYRMFSESGELVYIGSSGQFSERLARHLKETSWFCDVVTIKLEYFETLRQARQAEWLAIQAEHPLQNRAGVKKNTRLNTHRLDGNELLEDFL